MKSSRVAKLALGSGAAILALVVAPATAASASPAVFVPCPSPPGVEAVGLVNAITTANGSGGGTINLASGCTYSLNGPNLPINPNPLIGANGLPAVTTPITINGWNTTVTGNPASATPFRIFEVDGVPGGNLTVQGLTITGGSTPRSAAPS